MSTPQLYARVAQERDELLEQRDQLVAALELLLRELPPHRDWLDPDCERFARDALAEAKNSAKGNQR